MKVFVTGGTGLLGNNILRQLSDQGHSLVSLVRGQVDDSIFDGIETEFVHGDLSDVGILSKAIASCDAVIHSAAMIHLGWTKLDESMQANRDGTRTIVDACIDNRAKLVYVGTVNTLALGTPAQPANEDTPIEPAVEQVPCSYVTSKRGGVREVESGIQRGLRASIVHPGFMLGPWDWKPSSGRMMLEIARNWTPIAPSGGTSLCDARDVAAATIAAIDRGKDDGRQFVLAGHNMTYRDLWNEMSVRMKTQKPLMTAGPLQRWLGGVGGDLVTKITGKELDVNSAGVRMSSQYHWYDSTRAITELGYQIRDANETLDACADWIRKHHLLG